MKDIERILFWFQNGETRYHELTVKFYGLSALLLRLINERYEGQKIKFINIYFYTQEVYRKFPALTVNYVHYHKAQGGHLAYYGEIDISLFSSLSDEQQNKFIWEKSIEYLKICAKTLKNETLTEACEFAFNKGLQSALNQDYKMIEENFIIKGHVLNAAIWAVFKSGKLCSKFVLTKDNDVFFEKDIDQTEDRYDYFLEMYKKIDLQENVITIHGRKEVSYLPLKIEIPL